MMKTALMTGNGKALVITILFRLLFGGYLIGRDQFYMDDTGSALTVLVIYVLLGVFTAMFLFGKRYGLGGIIWLSVILIVLHTVFTVLALTGTTDAGMHDPLQNWWATFLRYPFFLLTLYFAIKSSRETRE